MPKEKIFYLCQFYGCRKAGSFDVKVILKHEKTCDRNPATRACISCAHEIVYREDPSGRRSCRYVDNTCEFLNKAFKRNRNVTSFVKNCDYYEEDKK